MKHTISLIALATFTLSACGTTTQDRTASGALIGAGAGAALGSVVGAQGYGAMVGAGVGAATGAMTPPDTINLGKPWWK